MNNPIFQQQEIKNTVQNLQFNQNNQMKQYQTNENFNVNEQRFLVQSTYSQINIPLQSNTQSLIKRIGDQKYELIEIQNGLEGTIYQGKNCLTGEMVAIKIQTKISDVEIQFFKQLKEKTLKHVVKITDIIIQQNESLLLMELGSGGMDKLMSSDDFNNMSIQMKNQLFVQMLKGIKEINDLGYVHRDLKPQNFIYFQDSNQQITVKLTDFGQIKELGILNSYQKGTMEYMAPEVLFSSNDQKYDHKCDIWSLGIIWYQMIIGQSIFQTKNEKQHRGLIKALTQSDINKIIDENLQHQDFEKAMIKELLTIDPDKRIQPETLIYLINYQDQQYEFGNQLQLVIKKSQQNKFNQIKKYLAQIQNNLPSNESYEKISKGKTTVYLQIKNQIVILQKLQQQSQEDKQVLLKEMKENALKIDCYIKGALIKQFQSKEIQLEKDDKELNDVLRFVNKKYLKTQIFEQKNQEIFFKNQKVLSQEIETIQKQIDSAQKQQNQREVLYQIDKFLNQQNESFSNIFEQFLLSEKIKQDYKQSLHQYQSLLALLNYIQLYHLIRFLIRFQHYYLREKPNQSQLQIQKIAQSQETYSIQYMEAKKKQDIYKIQITDGCDISVEKMEDDQKKIQQQIIQIEKEITIKNQVKLKAHMKNQNFIKEVTQQFNDNKEFNTMRLVDNALLQGRIHSETFTDFK